MLLVAAPFHLTYQRSRKGNLRLVLCGTFLYTFNFNFLGLAGYALGKERFADCSSCYVCLSGTVGFVFQDHRDCNGGLAQDEQQRPFSVFSLGWEQIQRGASPKVASTSWLGLHLPFNIALRCVPEPTFSSLTEGTSGLLFGP